MNELKLYQITDGFMEVNNIDNDLSEAEKNEINLQLNEALKIKSNNIIAYYKNENALLDGIKAEIERLRVYKSIVEGRIDRYKDYVKSNMEVLGIDKIETPVGTISLAKSPLSVEVINEDDIPAEFVEVVTTNKVDKKAISEHFKSTGEIVPGVKINLENKYLKIK
jgi:hypothetical protein